MSRDTARIARPGFVLFRMNISPNRRTMTTSGTTIAVRCKRTGPISNTDVKKGTLGNCFGLPEKMTVMTLSIR